MLNKLRKVAGYLLSWLLYLLGDWISRPMHYFDWAWLYPVYNRLMIVSVDLQGWSGITGPWKYNG